MSNDSKPRRGLTLEEIREFEQYAHSLLKNGSSKNEVKRQLIEKGAPEDYADYAVQDVVTERRELLWGTIGGGFSSILVALFLLFRFGGLALMLAKCSTAPTYRTYSNPISDSTSQVKYANTSKPKETLPEMPLPENGYGKFFFNKSKTNSKLKFVPQAELHGNMVVKIESNSTGKEICWFFVEDGKSVETPIPQGDYKFKIAKGEKWFGDEHLFGVETTYTQAPSVKIPARTNYTLIFTKNDDNSAALESTSLDAENF